MGVATAEGAVVLDSNALRAALCHKENGVGKEPSEANGPGGRLANQSRDAWPNAAGFVSGSGGHEAASLYRHSDSWHEPYADGKFSSSPHDSAAESDLPKLIHVPGNVNCRRATVFLDSGSQLDLISSAFVQAHDFQYEPADLMVRLPNRQLVPVKGKVTAARICMGSMYVTVRDVYMLGLSGNVDVILGKGWYDDADPIISWHHNAVKIFEHFPVEQRGRQRTGRWHVFAGSQLLQSDESASGNAADAVRVSSASEFSMQEGCMLHSLSEGSGCPPWHA